MPDIYILSSGQSNAVGREASGNFTIDSRVSVWNNKNDVLDATSYLGYAWVTPNLNANPFVNGCNNFAVHAASHLAKKLDLEVGLLIVATGALNIGNWYAAGARQWMFNRITNVLQAAQVPSLSGFFWQQGESDNSTNLMTYAGRWEAIKRELRKDGFINYQTPIVMGEASITHPGTNAIMDYCATLDNMTMVVPCKRFATKNDGTHFLGSEQERMGLIYAGIYMLLKR